MQKQCHLKRELLCATDRSVNVDTKYRRVYTLSQKNDRFLYFEWLGKNEPISIIFGVQYPEGISHKKIINLPNSPE